MSRCRPISAALVIQFKMGNDNCLGGLMLAEINTIVTLVSENQVILTTKKNHWLSLWVPDDDLEWPLGLNYMPIQVISPFIKIIPNHGLAECFSIYINLSLVILTMKIYTNFGDLVVDIFTPNFQRSFASPFTRAF